MGRTILGIAAGVVAAFVTVALIEAAGALIFPQAAPVDWAQQVAIDDWVASIPLGAKLIVVLGWFAGALIGAMVTARIARRRALGWVPPVLVVIAALANITMIPHPMWMSVSALLAPIVGGWVGTRLAGR